MMGTCHKCRQKIMQQLFEVTITIPLLNMELVSEGSENAKQYWCVACIHELAEEQAYLEGQRSKSEEER